MDGNQFDRLARVIGAATSRRGVLKTLAGSALGAIAAAGLGKAAAKNNTRCRLLDALCVQNQDCCSKQCCDGACCDHSLGCPAGQTRCQKSCVDLSLDSTNCGRCKHACPSSRTCTAGVCGCPEGTVLCDGVCLDTRDLDSDPNNCGACGDVCPQGQFCSEGLCGACRQLGDGCAAAGDCCSGYCDQGGCDLCPTGSAPCDGVCLDTRAFDHDPNNCGACGYICPQGQFCSEGLCGTCRQEGDGCGADGDCCSGNCNQGSCDSCLIWGGACTRNQECCSGACCGSRCQESIAYQSDPRNCGACNHGCGAAQGCCGGLCVDFNAPGNCGACGQTCGAKECCFGQSCVTPAQGDCGCSGPCPADFPVCAGDGECCTTDRKICQIQES